MHLLDYLVDSYNLKFVDDCIYHINDCTVIASEMAKDTNKNQVRFDIFNENSLDKILGAKGIIEKKGNLNLEEI